MHHRVRLNPAPAPLGLTWRERARPLVPVAVAAVGPVASALLRRLRRVPAEELGAFEGVATAGALVVLGGALPWVDGVVYLGRDPGAPSLLLPTAQEPTAPPGLLEQAIRRRVGGSWRVAVLLDPPRLAALGAPRSLDLPALDVLEARVRG